MASKAVGWLVYSSKTQKVAGPLVAVSLCYYLRFALQQGNIEPGASPLLVSELHDAVLLYIFQPFGEATLGKLGLLVIPLLVAVATFGSLIGSMFAGSRVTFNAARDSLLPECVGGIHKNFKTPLPAIILLVMN